MTFMGLLWVILLTLMPTFELRASIPYAILVEQWPWWLGGGVGIVANCLLAPLVWVFVDKVMHVFLHIKIIKRFYDWMSARSVRRLEPYVQKYGVIGLAFFIGIPFPGTGVYSGCLAAWLLNYRFRDYLMASCLGCLIAGAAVTAIVASGSEALHFLVKGP
ncbi:MAG: small multi-drug export protein [Proteobacteria bacterium]|jgi:uncharacterized membrane protein|nr:small multi-drug export protein [Pseudomonadota bacterium]